MNDIPQEVLAAQAKYDEELGDLRREFDVAAKCDKLFFIPHLPNYSNTTEVMRRVESKLVEQRPVMSYLISKINNQ